MGSNFNAAIKSGNARIEYIWHVGGMPWAVSTSQQLINNLTSAHRRHMFGDEPDTLPDTGTYFADHVDIYPLLQRPGKQTVTLHDAEAELTGGGWDVEIANLPVVPSWPYSKRTNIHGLEGLQAIANPLSDGGIDNAVLDADVTKLSSAVKITEDIGGNLETAFTAASSSAPKVIWVGQECIAANGWAAGSNSATIGAGWRGLLRSKQQSHYTNKSSSTSTRVCDAPLNGIGNRPCYLWAFVVDVDGVPLDDEPAKLRFGKVSSDISSQDDGSLYRVKCLPWWAWMDHELEGTSGVGQLKKYYFSKGCMAMFCGVFCDI